VWRAAFIWDDEIMLTRNPVIHAADGLRAIWFSSALPDYFPMTSTALWIQWRMWGANPVGYHLVNVLLHALSAVIWWRVFKRLPMPGAWLAAAIFALHPVNVESVAWITEIKNTLAMFFFALTLLAWLRFEDTIRSGGHSACSRPCGTAASSPAEEASKHPARTETGGHLSGRQDAGPLRQAECPPPLLPDACAVQWRWYAVALVTFVLALLSKTAVAPLPLVLLGLAWWRRGRVERRDIWRTAPFFALAALLAVVTVWFQYHRAIGASVVRTDGFGSRLATAGWAVWFYLYKAVLPLNLSFIYPRWQINATKALSYLPGLLAVGGLLLCWFNRRRWGKAYLLGLGYFVLMLLPILGFLNISFMRYSLVADRWQYFAILGPIALVAAGISRLTKLETRNSKLEGRPKTEIRTMHSAPFGIRVSSRLAGFRISSCGFRISTLPGGILLIALGVLTWRQCATFTDLETLWRTTLAGNPDCAMAHADLANVLIQKGQADEAMLHYRKALEIQPDYDLANYNYGYVLLQRGALNEAVFHLQKVLSVQPDSVPAHYHLGNAFVRQGRPDEATVHFRKAIEIAPDFVEARNSLGDVLLQQGHVDEAIVHFQKALEIQPDYPNALSNLGVALFHEGKETEAVSLFRRALEIQPGLVEARINLGKALLHQGQPREAVSHYRAAVNLQPDDPATLSDLAWVLATWPEASIRNGADAIELAQRASQLSGGRSPMVLRSLAAACAETGRYAEAVSAAQQALTLADSESNVALGDALRSEIKLYQASSPMRDGLKSEIRSSKSK
jgi:tetratricopeptide (TPR) repeat protein